MIIEVTLILRWALDQMVVMVISAPFTNEDHNYSFTSSMSHPRSDLVRLLVYDGMRTYAGYWCCIIGPSRQRQPYQEGVSILGRPYGR
jgi:hypothetical protein